MKLIRSLTLLVILWQVFVSCNKQDVLNVKKTISPDTTFSKADNEDSTLPFFKEIEEFEKEDSISFPPTGAILFTGSSSIRLWDHINSYFPGFTIIQRGFGGSGLTDLNHFVEDIITPYKPKQVVIYSGENDIASGRFKPADILNKFIVDLNKIRNDLPDVNIVYVSVKPSIKLKSFRSVINESNNLIKKFLSSTNNTEYVDVYHRMLDNDGKPRRDLFREDGLHLTTKGYEVWSVAIRPVLLR
jgi:lysophospholipase L1-like esterase